MSVAKVWLWCTSVAASRKSLSLLLLHSQDTCESMSVSVMSALWENNIAKLQTQVQHTHTMHTHMYRGKIHLQFTHQKIVTTPRLLAWFHCSTLCAQMLWTSLVRSSHHYAVSLLFPFRRIFFLFRLCLYCNTFRSLRDVMFFPFSDALHLFSYRDLLSLARAFLR